MTFAAERGQLPAGLWLIFAAVILWTLAFDTYYGMVDREDDLKIGIKSAAILFGRYDLAIIALLQLLSLGLLFVAGLHFGRGWIYTAGLLVAGGYFVRQHSQARGRTREAYFSAFLNNNRVGQVIFIGLSVDYFFQP